MNGRMQKIFFAVLFRLGWKLYIGRGVGSHLAVSSLLHFIYQTLSSMLQLNARLPCLILRLVTALQKPIGCKCFCRFVTLSSLLVISGQTLALAEPASISLEKWGNIISLHLYLHICKGQKNPDELNDQT